MDSILSNEKKCYVCGTPFDLHKHHIFYGTANRSQSEKHGLWVYLCAYHHNMSNEGVHFSKYLDNGLKQTAQREFEKTHSRDEFRKIFGKSWL